PIVSLAMPTSQIACGAWVLMSFNSGMVTSVGEGHVELAGDEAEDRCRPVRDDRVFDAFEIRPARLPVIRVAGELDVLVRLVVDEFEWASADRMLAHVAGRDMTRIDRGISRGEQRQQGRLWPLQMQYRFVFAGRRFRDIDPPGLAIIEAKLFFSLVGQE